ncbi:MAG: sulfite exporter TauE/SafE family protein [Luteolibacter sp.]
MSALAVIGALAIGLALGMTGAGGSILTFPVLVHLAGVSPANAVAMSLFIVGAAALVGAVQRAAMGHLHLRAAGWFTLSGMLGAVAGSRFTHMIPESALVLLFAAVMIVVGIRMWLGKSGVADPAPECKPVRCFLAGAGVGLVTGFLGVGGGFLLLPALTRFARLPVSVATGTSLAIIAINAFGGFLGHVRHANIDWLVVLTFSAIAVVAVLLGGRLAKRMNPLLLRRVFAVIVLLTAAGMLIF